MSRYVRRWVIILGLGCLVGGPALWAQDLDEDGLIAAEEVLIDVAIEGDMGSEAPAAVEPSDEGLVFEDVLVEEADGAAAVAENFAEAAEEIEEKGVSAESADDDAAGLMVDDFVFELPDAATEEVVTEEAEDADAVPVEDMVAEDDAAMDDETADTAAADEGLIVELPFDFDSEDAETEPEPEEIEEAVAEMAEVTEPEMAESVSEPIVMEVSVEESAPTEEVPAEEMPVDEMVAEEMPAEEMPAEEMVTEEMPAEEMVTEEMPAEEAPAEVMAEAEPEAETVDEPPAAEVVDLDSLVEQEFEEALQEGIPEAPAAAVVQQAAPDVRPRAPRGSPIAEQAAAARAAATARASEIELLREGEVLRRRAFEKHAESLLDEAAGEIREQRYQEAIRLYDQVLVTLRRVARPENERTRARALEGIRNSYYTMATRYLERRDLDEAEAAAEQAERYGHPRAGAILVRVREIREGVAVDAPPPPEPRRWKQEEFLDSEADIADRLRQGRDFIVSEEYDRAQFMFESVLKRDPHNTEAIRMLQKVSSRKYDIKGLELEATRDHMMADLRERWSKRPYAPEEDRRKFETVTQGARPPPAEMEQRKKIRSKMEGIIVPELDFRQAHIRDVIDFLSEASRDFDDPNLPDSEKGVNIILKLEAGESTSGRAVSEFPEFGGLDTPEPAAGGITQNITFSARYISLLEALKIVCDVAGLKYRIEPKIVMVLPQNAPEGDIINRTYNIVPTTITRLRGFAREITGGGDRRGGGDFTSIDGGSVAGETADLKDFFGELGVNWPDGSSIQYIEPLGKLVVANTVDNLAVFEGILPELDLVPKQVEIEARFVEVIRTDLDALGVEWLLTDDWEMAEKKGQGNIPLGGQQRIVVRDNEANGGFTTGNRFLSDGIEGLDAVILPNSDVLRIASVLTNPELEFVLHALEQRGNADVLSAPKVMTQSGSEATIKVVTEYIYPTDFEVTPVTAELPGGGSQIIGGVVEPSGFETREVGVILSVLPDVSPEGQMINLTLQPEVVDEPIFKNYGTTFTDPNGNVQQLNMEQPFFFTRTIQTSILIYNGATVVMGGMITEQRQDIDDKVPFLGDIPVFGRLFRSRYDRSEKRNLLIFVTARLVDPAGLPLGRAKSRLAEELIGSSESE